jgi:hypothetical protein
MLSVAQLIQSCVPSILRCTLNVSFHFDHLGSVIFLQQRHLLCEFGNVSSERVVTGHQLVVLPTQRFEAMIFRRKL